MKEWTSGELEIFRKDYNLTRKALGELLGVTVSSIYQWGRGLKSPSRTTKILLSRIEDELKKKGGKHGKRHL